MGIENPFIFGTVVANPITDENINLKVNVVRIVYGNEVDSNYVYPLVLEDPGMGIEAKEKVNSLVVVYLHTNDEAVNFAHETPNMVSVVNVYLVVLFD